MTAIPKDIHAQVRKFRQAHRELSMQGTYRLVLEAGFKALRSSQTTEPEGTA